jgi:hypothetical protein
MSAWAADRPAPAAKAGRGAGPRARHAGRAARVGLRPRKCAAAPVQEVVVTQNPSLDFLPILKCWPKDGGRFITLPQVITRNPQTGVRNVGMYRLQVVDERTLIVHWQRHKGGADHEQRARAACSRRASRRRSCWAATRPACGALLRPCRLKSTSICWPATCAASR